MSNVYNMKLDELADYLKLSGFNAEETIGICLLCKEEIKASEMLEYCKNQTQLELSDLLEKAVEIYKK